MSVRYIFKKSISILLISCLLITWLPVNVGLHVHSFVAEAAEPSINDTNVKKSVSKEGKPKLDSKDMDNDFFDETNECNKMYASASMDSNSKNLYEASFASLINQMNTTGIDVMSVMGVEGVRSPSEIDYRTRVSCEIDGPVYADDKEHIATIKFKLNRPSEPEVSFHYKIYDGSASQGTHFIAKTEGTITFGIGDKESDTVRELNINIPILENNSDDFWTNDRVLYINCNHITNALFENEKESLMVPVPIENQFDFKESYENGKNTYLVDLSNLNNNTETPGEFLCTGEGITIATKAAICGDAKTMIDTGVFSHLNMPVGYFLNKGAATGDIGFKIEINYSTGFVEDIGGFRSVDDKRKIDFNLGELDLKYIGFNSFDDNRGAFESMNVMIDDSGLTNNFDNVYTCFRDQNDVYQEKQINLEDKINPYVESVEVPDVPDVPDDFFYDGEKVPITVSYNEPVIIDNICLKVNDKNNTVLYPIEREGTVSNVVSFLYELNGNYNNLIDVTDITGAIDLSGKTQEKAKGYKLKEEKLIKPFDVEKTFAYCGDTTVNILNTIQDETINVKGEVIVSLKENSELSNWFGERVQKEKSTEGAIRFLLPVVKAKVIGKEGTAIDVPLYVNAGPVITELRGAFDAPENFTDQDNYYVAELFFDENNVNEFKYMYALSEEYVIPPIVFIDDKSKLEITYTDWPETDKISVNNEDSISLGYQVNTNATWQRPNDFLWNSSDETVATITSSGGIALTGTGTVTFTLTALNARLPGKEFCITSNPLVVEAVSTTFLQVPAFLRNMEIKAGDDAKVYYSTNITESNQLYNGDETVTTYSYELYEAEYEDSNLQKGDLIYRQTQEATVDADIPFHIIDSQYLVNTSNRGKYSYILEIAAKDLKTNKILSTSSNICVKELPAKAVLRKPHDYYVTDEFETIKVKFHIDPNNKNTKFLLSIMKNEEEDPVFSTDHLADMDKELMVAIKPVDSDRLLDVYTVLLKARNEFDEAFSYDSYSLYVYNKNALKIMVEGTAKNHLTMGSDQKLSTMTSDEILALNREISVTDKISINNKQYTWSSIADKITWEVGDESKISLKYNDGGVYTNIGDFASSSFFPRSEFILQGKSSGESFVTATHDFTGMQEKLDVTVDKIEDKLYLFQVYPIQKSVIYYINGNKQQKKVETDEKGRVAIYEASGIKSDVRFLSENSIYKDAVLKNKDILANQKSVNDFGLYPQNNVILPPVQYKAEISLIEDEYEDESERTYKKEVIIRGGVYRNGHYCPNAKINGIKGSVDQVLNVSGYWSNYKLDFNPLEFTSGYDTDPITIYDNIEYIIEVRFPDHSHNAKIIKIDNQEIRRFRNIPDGVFCQESIKKLDSENLNNNVSIISKTVTIDGQEQQMQELLVFDRIPQSATLDIELMFSGDSGKDYYLFLQGQYQRHGIFSRTVKKSYDFSDIIIMKNTFDLKNLLINKNWLDLSSCEKTNYYMSITYLDKKKRVMKPEIKLPVPIIKIQDLTNVPKMDALSEGELSDVRSSLISTVGGPYCFSFAGDNKQIKGSLDFLKEYSISKDSIRLEVSPTENPLVYKGIIKFAAGALTRENPSGVFMADGKSGEKYRFMPGMSDIKGIKKGDYIRKSQDQMQENLKGSKGTHKTYGGGAYLECEIVFDISSGEWKILILKSDVYIGGGGEYYRYYNAKLGPIPVTAEFRTGATLQIGLKTVANKVYIDEEEKEYDVERDYITELHPHFYIYGFGGFGADYEVASLKAGVYGNISMDQRYLWLNRKRSKTNGQKITIAGETGVTFKAKLLLIEYKKKYKLGGASKSWTFNDFKKIENVYHSKSGIKGKRRVSSLRNGCRNIVLEPVSETATLEDRSYINTFDRRWYSPEVAKKSAFQTLLDEDITNITTIETNAYPHSNPVITEDGEMMVYLSDMGSTDINDTAVCFTKKEEGVFQKSKEIDESKYADVDVAVDGTGNGAAITWIRMMSNHNKIAGEDATLEDVQNMMSDTEIMASIYNGTTFSAIQLTNNHTPDMAPVVATNGNKAIVVWRSLYASDMEDPLNFNGRDNIMYSIFDGEKWSEKEKCLYNGSINHVQALNVEMLSDGTSAITYQIKIGDTENTEIICAVLDENGNIINNIRLTNNEMKDQNPKITSAVFQDRIERFVIGWNSIKTTDADEEENVIRLSAINDKGRVYPKFEKEIENTLPASNYFSFIFTKGAKDLKDLSIVWTEPAQETGTDAHSIYRDTIWGKKLIQEENGIITESSKIKLLELDDYNVVDFYNSYVDDETKEINFAFLLSDYSGEELQAKLATAKSSYQNNLVVKDTYFSFEDLMPGLDMPVLFRLHNEGVEPINKVTINLGGVSRVYNEDGIKPGEYKDYTVFYNVPESIVDPDYRITASFLTSTDEKNGTLTMDIPDIGIDNIKLTKEKKRKRIFNVQIYNRTFSKLTEGKHVVKIQVYGTPDFNKSPIITKTISDTQSFDRINKGMFVQTIPLGEEELRDILDDKGEIPKDGARIYFNVVLEEKGTVIEDRDISNNSDYIKIHSLITQNGEPISFATSMQSEENHTIVQVEALNNSMNERTKGNIIVNLRDQRGNVIETKQTYNGADTGKGKGLITIGGEETYDATFQFNKDGAMSDVIYSDVVDDGCLLSNLKLKGIPLEFDKNVYEYDFQVTNLTETLITAVAENPNAGIEIFQNEKLISASAPCTLDSGTNTFKIVVKSSSMEVTYTVNLQNSKGEGSTSTHRHREEESVEESVEEYINTFKDVLESHWYYKAVQFVRENGLMLGTDEDEFSPNLQTSRGMFVTILYRMVKEPDVMNVGNFTDVKRSQYYAKAVDWAYENDIAKGISKTEFAANSSITREQLAVILYRYAAFMGYDTSAKTEIGNYIDSSTISGYAIPAMQWAVATGLIKGRSETEIAPYGKATRAEMAAILQRFLSK